MSRLDVRFTLEKVTLDSDSVVRHTTVELFLDFYREVCRITQDESTIEQTTSSRRYVDCTIEDVLLEYMNLGFKEVQHASAQGK